ncbi:MAG TPA: hypothetical protein PKM97_10775 [Bacteroidia bacterium]|nr:hypothetical protein [Bacteroidia bacterium]
MMEWILVTGYSFLFISLILSLKRFHLDGIPRKWLISVFCLKVISGICLGLIYTHVYTDRSTADTFKFFDDSRVIFASLSSKPYDFFRMFTGIGGNAPELRPYYVEMDAWLNTDVLFNDNKTIIRLNVLFQFFSLGKYYVHVVFINFISFIGLFYIYKTFVKYIPSAAKILFVSTFLIPSVLFWGSGLLKDGLLIFAFGIMLYSYDKLYRDPKNFRHLPVFIFSFLLLVFTKLYILIIIIPGLVAWYWARNQAGTKAVLKFSVCYLLYFIIAFNIHHIVPKYNVTDIIYWKQHNFHTLAEITDAKSIFDIPKLEYGILSIIKNSPVAFFNTLIRPLPTDIHGNKLIMAASIENIFILLFILTTILFRKKSIQALKPIYIFSLFFIVILFVITGLITPILGALVRYKVPALPFLMFILINLIDPEKIKKFSESWRQ